MTTEELKQFTGNTSFFEFYKSIQANPDFKAVENLHFRRICPDGVQVRASITVASIKERVLAELMERLPSKSSIQVMREMAQGGPETRNHVHTFLNNLLTRD